ncbi:dUTP diphosphatase [Leekyejoonella antrihumi]|uniref:Deoxyuridine 5'-triphosphate nucleotidohydrolase n=1 Tax=Leekyejoonella antrihumi TaxID=1660198 RepID=A0A563E328_9MICO|nr:dUTP diphosphatase [Leekyejoonella antrihumi]TWP36937.1 dUTP diphosphatase [Leekyejoonella antrihumi]
MSVSVQITYLDPELPALSYAQPGDAGLDLHARERLALAPGERALVPTGIALALPEGYAGFVHPRSGLAARHGISMVNAPGTIDAGYRGEVLVNLINLDPRETFVIERADRIAQLIVQQVAHVTLVPSSSLPDSVRGHTGHGASGGFAGHERPAASPLQSKSIR